MAKATVRVAARKRPLSGSFDRDSSVRATLPLMNQCENGIESSVPIARGHVEQPTAIGFLVAQNPGDHFLRLGRFLADKLIIVRCMKRGGNMVIEVSSFILHHERSDPAVRLL